jgi:hypothetical protein
VLGAPRLRAPRGAPPPVHELFVSWFIGHFGDWLAPRRGFVFGSGGKFAVAPRRGRKPDVTVYLPGSK